MGIKLYVGNLAYTTKQEDLNDFFSDYGAVQSVKIITDRETGRSKGFAFVEMSDESEGRSAIDKANGVEFQGRKMNVSEAKPQEPRAPRSGGFDRNNDRGSKRW